MIEGSALRYVKGLGPRRADALAASGIESLSDLVEVFPFRWEDRRAFARVAERSGRAQDAEDGGGLETLRRDGYM